MVTEKQIIEAWAFLRTENNSLPDEVIDFIKDASLAILNKKMVEIKMYLFLCSTGVGEYYVIAKDCLSALNKTEEFLNAAEYGSYEDRKVMNIKVLAENATDLRFITNKFLIV